MDALQAGSVVAACGCRIYCLARAKLQDFKGCGKCCGGDIELNGAVRCVGDRRLCEDAAVFATDTEWRAWHGPCVAGTERNASSGMLSAIRSRMFPLSAPRDCVWVPKSTALVPRSIRVQYFDEIPFEAKLYIQDVCRHRDFLGPVVFSNLSTAASVDYDVMINLTRALVRRLQRHPADVLSLVLDNGEGNRTVEAVRDKAHSAFISNPMSVAADRRLPIVDLARDRYCRRAWPAYLAVLVPGRP